jgi:hypothetical protein
VSELLPVRALIQPVRVPSKPRGMPVGVTYEIEGAIAPEHRGQGLATAAQDLLVEYLLDHTTANRIEALTNDANIAEQKALERLGFRQEGLMRGRSFLRASTSVYWSTVCFAKTGALGVALLRLAQLHGDREPASDCDSCVHKRGVARSRRSTHRPGNTRLPARRPAPDVLPLLLTSCRRWPCCTSSTAGRTS